MVWCVGATKGEFRRQSTESFEGGCGWRAIRYVCVLPTRKLFLHACVVARFMGSYVLCVLCARTENTRIMSTLQFRGIQHGGVLLGISTRIWIPRDGLDIHWGDGCAVDTVMPF